MTPCDMTKQEAEPLMAFVPEDGPHRATSPAGS